MLPLRHLNSLQALESAVRLGSQKAAADELGITPAAVGQRIRALEDYLGTRLLERGRTGVSPTPALRNALDALAAGFASLGEAADLLRYSSHHTVVLNAEPDWAALWLQPRLDHYLERNRHAEVLVDTTQSSTDRYDLRVRFGSGAAGESGETLYQDYLLPVAAPDLIRRIEKLPRGEKLEGFPLLHLEPSPGAPLDWPAWVARHGQRRGGADRGVRYRRVTPALRAARSGAGVLICGMSLVLPHLESGELLLPFGAAPGRWDERGYVLDTHAPALKRPAVQEFRDWLIHRAQDTRDRLGALTGS